MTSAPLDILIGYDDKLIYEGLASLLSSKSSYNVMCGVRNGEDLFKRIKINEPKIIIIELGVPNKIAVEYLKNLHSEYPFIQLMLISSICNNGNISSVMESGISSFLLKNCNKEDLFNAIDHLEDGKKYFCSTITQFLLKEYQEFKHSEDEFLTHRELEVLQNLVVGDSNKEIAANLKISESTVKTHRKNLMAKMGTNNLISLVRYACRNNLIEFGLEPSCVGCPYKQ